jgi:hypothetical protein
MGDQTAMSNAIDFHREEAPTEKSFGYLFTVVFALVSGYFFYKGKTHWMVTTPISIVFLLVTLACPIILKYPFKLWMGIGLVMHKIVNPVVMGILFYFVVTPFGLIARIFGAKFLALEFKGSDKSYWKEKEHLMTVKESMKNQF